MLPCPAGYYCPVGGAKGPSSIDEVAIITCAPGYYCPAGSDVMIKCPIGKYNSVGG